MLASAMIKDPFFAVTDERRWGSSRVRRARQ
jgi:hypothetical protein